MHTSKWQSICAATITVNIKKTTVSVNLTSAVNVMTIANEINIWYYEHDINVTQDVYATYAWKVELSFLLIYRLCNIIINTELKF